jgi:predicted ABC-type ATPase
MAHGSLLLLAGPNGAGKSTLIQSVREELGITSYTSLNADERTQQKIIQAGFAGFDDVRLDIGLLKTLFIESANEVYQEALDLLNSGRDVCLETVLSTEKYCTMVTEVLEKGGAFEMFYLALKSPELSEKRVRIRVRKLGHDVPVDRLKERWQRSLSFLPWFARRATNIFVFDNSGEAPVIVAKGGGGALRWHVDPESVFPELRLALESEFPELKQT